MLPIFNSIVSWYFKKRIEEVQRAIDNPVDTQQTVFKDLIEHGAYTEFGKAYGFKSIKNFDDFRNRVPIHDYEDLPKTGDYS